MLLSTASQDMPSIINGDDNEKVEKKTPKQQQVTESEKKTERDQEIKV